MTFTLNINNNEIQFYASSDGHTVGIAVFNQDVVCHQHVLLQELNVPSQVKVVDGTYVEL